VDQIADAIEQQIAQPLSALADTADGAAGAAMAAESAAESVGYDVTNVERMVRDLQRVVEDLQDGSPESLAARVVQRRRHVWWDFTVDTWERTSVRAERLARALHDVLSRDISLDSARNTWELRVLDDLLGDRRQQRGQRATLKWWHEAIKEVEAFLEAPGYQAPELPDLRAELRADLDTAMDDPNSLTRQFKAQLEK